MLKEGQKKIDTVVRQVQAQSQTEVTMFDFLRTGTSQELRQGIIRIDRDLLRSALRLPEGTKILDVNTSLFVGTGDIAIVVEHPDLNPVHPGSHFPIVVPQLSVESVQLPPKFEGWVQ